MAYSFPVYRKGMILRTTQQVSVERASRIAEQVSKRARRFETAFKHAAVRNNNAGGFRTNATESVRQLVPESFLLSLPSMILELAEFTVKSRVSLTVCMHGHQHKLWLLLLCTHMNKEPARKLSAEDLRRYFSLAADKAGEVLPALSKVYRNIVEQSGVSVPKSDPYYFQFRAFNSQKRSSADLCADLRKGLSLNQALQLPKYRQELVDYFRVVLEDDVAPEDVTKAIDTYKLELIGYKSEEHEALFTVNAKETDTDFCGYGFDRARKPDSEALAQAATKDLLNEYGQLF